MDGGWVEHGAWPDVFRRKERVGKRVHRIRADAAASLGKLRATGSARSAWNRANYITPPTARGHEVASVDRMHSRFSFHTTELALGGIASPIDRRTSATPTGGKRVHLADACEETVKGAGRVGIFTRGRCLGR